MSRLRIRYWVAIRTVGSVHDPLHEDVDGRAQEDDGIKAVIQGALISHAAGHEQPARAVPVEQRADPSRSPTGIAHDALSEPGHPGVRDPRATVLA